MMKRWILGFLVCFFSISGVSSLVVAQKMYVEGQFGLTMVDDVDSTVASGSLGKWSASFTNVLEYDDVFEYGLEIGVQKILNSQFRAGISFSQFDLTFKKGTLGGAVSYDGTLVASGELSYGRSDLDALGITFDNEVKLYSLNAYYDLQAGAQIFPYVGLGIGLTDIENAKDDELTFSFYMGANYQVTDKLYLGLRGGLRRVNGPTDNLEIQYDDITAWNVGVVIGIIF